MQDGQFDIQALKGDIPADQLPGATEVINKVEDAPVVEEVDFTVTQEYIDAHPEQKELKLDAVIKVKKEKEAAPAPETEEVEVTQKLLDENPDIKGAKVGEKIQRPKAVVVVEDPAKKAADDAKAKEDEIRSDAMNKLFKELGVSTLEEAKKKMSPPKDETVEQKEEREKLTVAAVDNYAVTSKIMKREELVALEVLKKEASDKIVYKNFAEEFKKTKPDATEDDIQVEFDIAYHTKSTSEFLKKQGAALIEERATAIKNELQTKYDKAKDDYTYLADRKAKMPEFKQVITNALNEFVPETIVLHTAKMKDENDKEIELPINFKIPADDKKEYEKLLLTNDVFDLFFEGKTQQTKDLIKDKIEGLIYLKNKEQMFATIAEAAGAAARKAGAKGSTEPFDMTKPDAAKPLEVAGTITAEQDKKVNTVLG